MSTYPKSPSENVGGLIYFPRMLDKIRLHARGELGEAYHKNLGTPRTADDALCNFLRIKYSDLHERVLEGGSDEEILEWCYEKGRRPNAGDIFLWNGFASKIGFRDFATATLERMKKEHGVADRADIATMPDMMDFEEGRKS